MLSGRLGKGLMLDAAQVLTQTIVIGVSVCNVLQIRYISGAFS